MMKLVACSAFFLAGFALVGVSQPCAAQEAAEQPAAADAAVVIPEPKIAVIDVQTIQRESKAAATLREQLDTHRREIRDQVAKLEDELRDAQRELSRQRSVLTPAAFEKKQREWERQASALNRDVEVRKQQLDIAFENSLAQIQNALVRVVRRISEEQEINIVLPKAMVWFFSADMDITSVALIGLDKELPSVKVDMGAAAKATSRASPVP